MTFEELYLTAKELYFLAMSFGQSFYTNFVPVVYITLNGGRYMTHTFEVLVDIRECPEAFASICRNGTMRYEIDAETKEAAYGMARSQARNDYPKGTEYDARVTRLLR